MLGVGEPERLSGVGVAQNFLSFLGVRPILGRNFTEEEAQDNAPLAVILTQGLWNTRFGADPKIVGRQITLNNGPATVVGVLPADFDFSSVFVPGSQVDMLVPFPLTQRTDRWGNTLAVIGRLKPGVTVQQGAGRIRGDQRSDPASRSAALDVRRKADQLPRASDRALPPRPFGPAGRSRRSTSDRLHEFVESAAGARRRPA
jgi:hypothetical protein